MNRRNFLKSGIFTSIGVALGVVGSTKSTAPEPYSSVSLIRTETDEHFITYYLNDGTTLAVVHNPIMDGPVSSNRNIPVESIGWATLDFG